MEEYKRKFIDFLLKSNALGFGDFTLKSKRESPWFINVGDFNTALTTKVLGEAYADVLSDSNCDFDILYGIPEKGKALSVSTAIAMASKNPDLPWFSTRKDAKNYGEASNLSPEERAKAIVIGRIPKNGQSIAQLDDVLTDGGAKYEARELLESFGNFNYPILAIAVDRQEVDKGGRNAIREYAYAKTNNSN